MAMVKTFRIPPKTGVPDKEVRDFINSAEKNAIVRVTTVLIPAVEEYDARLCVIVTKLDDLAQEVTLGRTDR
ncbi:MAG: hypothetical protein E6R03_01845 [Hyphomicrobiaceae bacterium]|nr:MAG: hypothetical protein E6R03_01845 [Hyphomicrobiaceae bacterium]